MSLKSVIVAVGFFNLPCIDNVVSTVNFALLEHFASPHKFLVLLDACLASTLLYFSLPFACTPVTLIEH